MNIRNIFEMGELFEKVQLSQIFPDSKTFPDCLPKKDLDTITRLYETTKELPSFDLGKFVRENFDQPQSDASGYQSDPEQTPREHIEALWEELTRQPSGENSSLIRLPYPYIVPGGRFREIYYWDSYFTMLGLQVSRRIDMIQQMVDNFSFLIQETGHIPNGNRTYYQSRSQPPFYALMVSLLSEEKGPETLVKYLPELKKEYSYWMKGASGLNAETKASLHVVRMPDGSLLNRYWDELDTPRPEAFQEDIRLAKNVRSAPVLFRHLRAAAESGWDFSGRWCREEKNFATIHTAEIIPVDLNCLLYYLETILYKACLMNGEPESAGFYQQEAEKRSNAIDRYCWNDQKCFYYDYDFCENSYKQSQTLAAVFPLFFGIASPVQAARVAGALGTKFLQPGGLCTTLTVTGQQWDAPNGWAPLQWVAYKGLLQYGFKETARQIRQAWMDNCLSFYARTGRMTEKYDVSGKQTGAGGGEYPNQDGFGWTNGVLLAMMVS